MASSSHTFEENLAAADTYLARFKQSPLLHLINGEHVGAVSGDRWWRARRRGLW